ncbi:MAG: glycoside hydrolase family 88 protein, partial [Candidatus Marinimicrobia bacterium]|nr:glycoside hydrolase family 88 protein [Candidatus Neomarinimicrobiota bacterium]
MNSFFRVIMSGIIGMLFTSTIFGASGEKISSLEKQIDRKYQVIGEKYPEYTVDGEWKFREKPNWFSGFIGGQYWLTYELTGKQKYKEWALARADHLLQFADLDNTHDMGFIFLPTAVRSYKETGQEKYRKAGIQAAEMLAKRFNENGEFIRAWGKLGTPEKAGWMIIDTMMNLELLFWAAEETGNWEYYDIA